MDCVEAIGFHVIGETRRAADPGYEDRVLRVRLQLSKRVLDRFQDRVISTTGTPANFLIGRVVACGQFFRGALDIHLSSPAAREWRLRVRR